MESNQLKTLKIDWLGHCPTCEREQHSVATSEGNKDYLYEDDTVKCWCGQTGVIETDGQGHAWCNWDEKAVSEWDKFNIYYRQKYPEYWGLLPKANHQACSHHEELFNSWVTAKSQAVPEGFVLVPVKEIKTWYLDDSENIYREDPEWLCDIPVGEVVEVEHRVSYELDQDPVFAAIQWDEENSDVGYYETFKSKAEAEKVAAHCKAMVEAQEQSHD